VQCVRATVLPRGLARDDEGGRGLRWRGCGDEVGVESSTLLEGLTTNAHLMLVRSVIDEDKETLNADGLLSKGDRLIVGENTRVCL